MPHINSPTTYKLVLFDLGRRGLPGHTQEKYLSMGGHGIRNLVKQALPEESPAEERLPGGDGSEKRRRIAIFAFH